MGESRVVGSAPATTQRGTLGTEQGMVNSKRVGAGASLSAGGSVTNQSGGTISDSYGIGAMRSRAELGAERFPPLTCEDHTTKAWDQTPGRRTAGFGRHPGKGLTCGRERWVTHSRKVRHLRCSTRNEDTMSIGAGAGYE